MERRAPASLHLPEKVAAKDEAEHEHKKADAQHDDIHIEREVIDLRRHAAVVFRAPRSRTTQASWQEEFAERGVSDHFFGAQSSKCSRDKPLPL